MKAEGLLDELASLGVHLVRDGDAIFADVEDGADLHPVTDRIRENKVALLAALRLREEIVTAASAVHASFDRQHYDSLWERWYALQEQEAT